MFKVMFDSMSPLQVSLAAFGGLTLVAVVIYNQWTSRKNAPRQADPVPDTHAALQEPGLDADPIEPVLTDDFGSLPQPERKPLLDALIDAMATIEVDHPVSGDAALAALPATRRVGTKPFHVEGCSELSGEWEPLVAGRRYSAFQAGVQLANRVGALNEIEFSEFVVKTQAFADAVGGTPSFSDMLHEVARARELDQFASAHDAQLSFTLCARAAAWSPGYIQQHAARHGFVAGVIPGRMVLPAEVQGLPPILSLTFDTQAALADDPAMSAIRDFSLSLDVPQIAREEQPFERLRQAAQLLATDMDGVITDGEGHLLGDDVLDQIANDLRQLYEALDERELAAGSSQARRLFS
jgi:ZipA, C-terminal FtsZ-binding domain